MTDNFEGGEAKPARASEVVIVVGSVRGNELDDGAKGSAASRSKSLLGSANRAFSVVGDGSTLPIASTPKPSAPFAAASSPSTNTEGKGNTTSTKSTSKKENAAKAKDKSNGPSTLAKQGKSKTLGSRSVAGRPKLVKTHGSGGDKSRGSLEMAVRNSPRSPQSHDGRMRGKPNSLCLVTWRQPQPLYPKFIFSRSRAAAVMSASNRQSSFTVFKEPVNFLGLSVEEYKEIHLDIYNRYVRKGKLLPDLEDVYFRKFSARLRQLLFYTSIAFEILNLGLIGWDSLYFEYERWVNITFLRVFFITPVLLALAFYAHSDYYFHRTAEVVGSLSFLLLVAMVVFSIFTGGSSYQPHMLFICYIFNFVPMKFRDVTTIATLLWIAVLPLLAMARAGGVSTVAEFYSPFNFSFGVLVDWGTLFVFLIFQAYQRYLHEQYLRMDLVNRYIVQSQQFKLDKEHNVNSVLLESMLPVTIISSLINGIKPKAQEHPCVSVLFCEVHRFSQISISMTPKAIVVVLNNIFKEFDELADKFVDEIHKVETVGAVYMMCSGVTTPCARHATVCCEMARDMMKAIPSVRAAIAEDFNSLKRSSTNFQTHSIKDLTIRVGVNTGSLVAGICGRNNPRFKLFGDTVNTASRMESTAPPGHIQLSGSARDHLVEREGNGKDFTLKERFPRITPKGKKEMRTYFLVHDRRRPTAGTARTGRAQSASSPTSQAFDLQFGTREGALGKLGKVSTNQNDAGSLMTVSSPLPSEEPKLAGDSLSAAFRSRSLDGMMARAKGSAGGGERDSMELRTVVYEGEEEDDILPSPVIRQQVQSQREQKIKMASRLNELDMTWLALFGTLRAKHMIIDVWQSTTEIFKTPTTASRLRAAAALETRARRRNRADNVNASLFAESMGKYVRLVQILLVVVCIVNSIFAIRELMEYGSRESRDDIQVYRYRHGISTADWNYTESECCSTCKIEVCNDFSFNSNDPSSTCGPAHTMNCLNISCVYSWAMNKSASMGESFRKEYTDMNNFVRRECEFKYCRNDHLAEGMKYYRFDDETSSCDLCWNGSADGGLDWNCFNCPQTRVYWLGRIRLWVITPAIVGMVVLSLAVPELLSRPFVRDALIIGIIAFLHGGFLYTMIITGKPGIGLTSVAIIMCSEISVIPLAIRIILNIGMTMTYYVYIMGETWKWIDPRFEVMNVPSLGLLRNQWAATDLTCPNIGKPQYVISPNYTRTDVLASPVLFTANRAIYLGLITVLVMIPALSREILSRVHQYKVMSIEEQQTETSELNMLKKALLAELIPESIIPQVKSGALVAEKFRDVTIMFTDLKGFTAMSSSISPVKLLKFLNNLYTKFDLILSSNEVYKVEVIGDAYFVVGGCPNRCDDHVDKVCNAAVEMLHALVKVCREAKHVISMRIGMHTGAVVAGVVGTKDPRYHLFGKDVQEAERMEQTGEPGKVHLTRAAHNALRQPQRATITTLKTAMPRKYTTEKRGTMDTYFLAWKSTGKVVNVSLATAPGATVSKVATHKQAQSAGSEADLVPTHSRKQRS